MKCPCYKCEDRHEGCHGECERYIEWSGQKQKEKAERDAATRTDKEIVVFRSEQIRKQKRKSGKK